MFDALTSIRKKYFPTDDEMDDIASDPEIRALLGLEYEEDRPVSINPEFVEKVHEMGGLPPILPIPSGDRDDN